MKIERRPKKGRRGLLNRPQIHPMNPKYLKELPAQDGICANCRKPTKGTAVLIKDTRPHKVATCLKCEACGAAENTIHDAESLPYGVRITCRFPERGLHDSLARMVFINSTARVMVKVGGEDLFEFSCEDSYVDCIQGLLMHGADILASVGNKSGIAKLANIKKTLDDIIKGREFELLIEDGTGFSKVCPLRKEYTAVQDMDPTKLNDKHVRHEKIAPGVQDPTIKRKK